MGNRFRQITMLALLGFFLGTASAWHQVSKEQDAGYQVAQIEPAAGTSLMGSEIGGPFTLIDHEGRQVTERNYEGSYKLIFFGFTYCPDVCPVELRKMAEAMKEMGPVAANIQPIFITTDPARDTPETMKQYVKMFHPRLVGLTGSPDELKKVRDEYKVYAAKVEDPKLSDYTMNHSSYMFLMGPDNEPLALFTTQDSPADIAQDVQNIIGNI